MIVLESEAERNGGFRRGQVTGRAAVPRSIERSYPPMLHTMPHAMENKHVHARYTRVHVAGKIWNLYRSCCTGRLKTRTARSYRRFPNFSNYRLWQTRGDLQSWLQIRLLVNEKFQIANRTGRRVSSATELRTYVTYKRRDCEDLLFFLARDLTKCYARCTTLNESTANSDNCSSSSSR